MGEADAGLDQLALDWLPDLRFDSVSPSSGLPEGGKPDDVCLMLQTSRTTSRPKMVPVRHRNLTASANTIASGCRLTRTHRAMPLFDIHGLVGSALSPFALGAQSRSRASCESATSNEHVEAWRATWCSAPPTAIARLLDATRDQRPSTLRFARASSPLPVTPISAFEDRFEVPLIESYGMTEASHQMASNPLPRGERRQGSVGLPTGTEIAIVDDQCKLASGASGEVAVRGRSGTAPTDG